MSGAKDWPRRIAGLVSKHDLGRELYPHLAGAQARYQVYRLATNHGIQAHYHVTDGRSYAYYAGDDADRLRELRRRAS